MRVISGSARGLKLISPNGLNTRPTTDRIKESLFNMIAYDLADVDFLDLFSGTGSIGIEALSRGATHSVFVDNSKDSIDIINLNLEKARFLEKATVYNSEAITAIRRLQNEMKQFDIIFMDPPYDKGIVQQTLNEIVSCNILKKNGFIICEQSIKEDDPYVEKLEIFKEKKYKTTKMVFLQYVNGD